MLDFEQVGAPTSATALVAFTGLNGFDRRFVHGGRSDEEVFRTMDGYAEFAGELINEAGGHTVKVIGDGLLVVFPDEGADGGVVALMKLKATGDDWLRERDIPCEHAIKVHYGPLVYGRFGPRGDKRIDVYGKTVNVCARMRRGPLVLSAQAFRALSKATRTRFKKHTPPVTYIRVEDPHPG